MTLFEEILENKTYSELLKNLPDDERPVIMASLQKFVENFETKILQPASKILSDDKS
jgi:hypothetical protein